MIKNVPLTENSKMVQHLKIEPAQKIHNQAIISLIDEILREYNQQICLERADNDLLDIDKNYFQKQGKFWVVTNEQQKVVGTLAFKIIEMGNSIEVKRFYLQKAYRGCGIAPKMIATIIDWAKTNHYQTITLWSDILFLRGHRFYEKMGFQNSGVVRHMEDSYDPYSEWEFVMSLVDK